MVLASWSRSNKVRLINSKRNGRRNACFISGSNILNKLST
uniref:Uncharacterized protein n=1 Tax=Arundo donax TaxID=35708 RepID=A0A0A9GPL4_ARUDO